MILPVVSLVMAAWNGYNCKADVDAAIWTHTQVYLPLLIAL
jgi:hypothetical protein